MAEASGESARKFVLSRRATGIGDLKAYTIENGDLNMEIGLTAGVYRINCNHSVGIATTTEVGLTPDRYVIKVVILSIKDKIPTIFTATCCRYWRIVNADLKLVPFNRKPLATDLALKTLYDTIPTLDDILWRTHNALTVAYSGPVTRFNKEIDTPNAELYPLLMLAAPTDAQKARIIQLVDMIAQAAMQTKSCAYIKITDTLFLFGKPAGNVYSPKDQLSTERVSFFESVLTLKANYIRMKRRYPDLEDGYVTLGAYTTASMFRMGLAEHYENKEYYTVYVSPMDAAGTRFTVRDIVVPNNAPLLEDYVVGDEMDLDNVRLKAQLVEVGNLMVIASGMMHYMFNHTTGGNVVTGVLLTVMAMYQYITSATDHNLQVMITSLMYEALHPVNKRAVANLFFDGCKVYTHGRAHNDPAYELFILDAFTQIRTKPYPAGSHKAFIAAQALKRVLNAGLGPFLPWSEEITSMIDTCRGVLTAGARAHIGANYYTGEAPTVQPATLDRYLPELAHYVHTFNKGDSLSMSPHMSLDHSRRCGMNWSNMLKALKSSDISGTDIDVVRRYLETAGKVHFQFDPDDEMTWAKAVDSSKLAVKVIDGLFD